MVQGLGLADIATRVTNTGTSTDNHIARFDGTTGKIVQDNSPAVLSDAGALSDLTGIISSGTVQSTGVHQTSGTLIEDFSTDATTTGANAAISSPTTPAVRLTNVSLTSVDTIASPSAGRVITVLNQTGASITINNDTGATTANRIYTGTGAALTLTNQASILLKYDGTAARWMVIGGSGGGGGTVPDADATTKGILKLAGDLGGTASLPTVPGLAAKAPLASPTFTGTPSAPTPSPADNSTKLATTAYVDGAIASSSTPASVLVSALDIDWSLGSVFYKSVSTNSTITFSNTQDGKVITFAILNTSGATITLTFPTLVKDATFEVTVDASKENLYTFVKANSKVYASYISRMS
jgi:hypothetical protein